MSTLCLRIYIQLTYVGRSEWGVCGVGSSVLEGLQRSDGQLVCAFLSLSLSLSDVGYLARSLDGSERMLTMADRDDNIQKL